MRASAIKEGQGSSGAITHAGGADEKVGGNGETEGAESVPAEKQTNESKGVEKPISSGTEKQASRGTAYKSASGNDPVVLGEDGTRKKAGRPRKQRLLSYSSQDSNSQDDTGSRKSTRKRTTVSKWGSVMIDAITRDKGKGKPTEKCRDTA